MPGRGASSGSRPSPARRCGQKWLRKQEYLAGFGNLQRDISCQKHQGDPNALEWVGTWAFPCCGSQDIQVLDGRLGQRNQSRDQLIPGHACDAAARRQKVDFSDAAATRAARALSACGMASDILFCETFAASPNLVTMLLSTRMGSQTLDLDCQGEERS